MVRPPDPTLPPPECGVCDAAELPPEPGAYALLIGLERSVDLPKRCVEARLAAGRYVYFGSANGGGGIRARCRRHFKAEKAMHWHVDRLTVGPGPGRVRAIAFPGTSECALVQRVMQAGGLVAPVRGFGNSDCRTCPAHLFVLLETVPWERIVETLRQGGGQWTQIP